jgi:RNA polymerase sigma factor (sigma-70 family)
MSTIEPIVYIVDDDPAFRESLSILILAIGYRSKTYDSADAFLKTFDQTKPGCIILDVRMPRISGLALQEKLIAFPQCPPIIILTGHGEVSTALRALKQGAIEFLQKTFSELDLRDAVERAIALDTTRREEHAKRQELLARLAQLTTPERQVLNLVLAGYPNKRIASSLDVSQRAVEDRRSRVMQKLNVYTLPDLVRLAVDAGLKIDK